MPLPAEDEELNNHSATIIIYGYTPSYPLAISASVLFSVLLLIHLVQVTYYRAWYFATLPVALVLEILGYIFRSFSAHKDPYSVIYFVLQYFFIVTAPVFISAGIYAVLSVLINRVGRQYSPLGLKPKTILWVFISADVVCTILQIAGAAMIGSAESNRKNPNTGNNILTAGLAAQVFCFAVFIALLGVFLYQSKGVVWRKGWRWFLVGFVVAILCVYLRTVFRLVETAEGVRSRLFTSEGFFCGLEFVPILVAVLLLGVWFPGRCLGKKSCGTTEDAEGLDLGVVGGRKKMRVGGGKV